MHPKTYRWFPVEELIPKISRTYVLTYLHRYSASSKHGEAWEAVQIALGNPDLMPFPHIWTNLKRDEFFEFIRI